MHTIFKAALVLVIFIPIATFAQQLRIVETNTIEMDPSVYRAYYGQLSGEPHVYTFSVTSEAPFKALLLVPDVPEAVTSVSATLVSVEKPEELFIAADGGTVEWQRFFDTAGRDWYLAGPSIDTTLPAGDYRIQVSSANDDARYVLVISGASRFSLGDIVDRFSTVPNIKSQFFGKSASEAFVTPLLLWPLLSLFIFAGIVVLIVMIRRRSRGTL